MYAYARHKRELRYSSKRAAAAAPAKLMVIRGSTKQHQEKGLLPINRRCLPLREFPVVSLLLSSLQSLLAPMLRELCCACSLHSALLFLELRRVLSGACSAYSDNDCSCGAIKPCWRSNACGLISTGSSCRSKTVSVKSVRCTLKLRQAQIWR